MRGIWVICLLFTLGLQAQTGMLVIQLTNELSNEPTPFVTVSVQPGTHEGLTDVSGIFVMDSLTPGFYNITIQSISFVNTSIYEVEVKADGRTVLPIALTPFANQLQAVSITVPPAKPLESTTSLYTLGATEIQRNPGGQRDLSRSLQSLPGVASTVNFRNDLLIRGGAPNENSFYIDGIEVPHINHFATQGATGGPVGMINVDFLQEVKFYTGAFPANRNGALSSITDMRLRKGNPDHLRLTATVGASDIGAALDGPVGNKTTYLLGVRRSYLQLLFKVFQLPYLPVYNDAQFKITHQFDAKNELTVIGLGAIDRLDLNLDANETELQQYLLDNIPVIDQKNYTLGAKYTRHLSSGLTNIILSRHAFYNRSYKYLNNKPSNALAYDYLSIEQENQARLERIQLLFGDIKITYGLSYAYTAYSNSTFDRYYTQNEEVTIDYASEFTMNRYGLFLQASRLFLGDRLSISGGLRVDGTDYSEATRNPLEQFSPRVALSWKTGDRTSLNASGGIFYQLPPYTILGFQDSTGTFINKVNGIRYIQAAQMVIGIDRHLPRNTTFTAEIFYKHYGNYPFLVNDSVALANFGADFGVVGNEEAIPGWQGMASGVELYVRKRLFKSFFGMISYSYIRSYFEDKQGEYQPSLWDTKHILALQGGWKLKRDWEIGFRFRYQGGAPYTPYDSAYSSLITVFDSNREGVRDYDLLNSERVDGRHQLDLRFDKRWYFEKWTLNAYLDIQNFYRHQAQRPPYLIAERDENGDPLVNPNDPARYQTRLLENETGTLLPTIGLVVEF